MDMGIVNSNSQKTPPINHNNNNNNNNNNKCLLFDRRYGFVYDVWKDPSEEALYGGRGMFCIVPLSKALIKSASDTINFVANSTFKVLEKPDLLTPEVLQLNINNHVQKIMSSMKKPEFDLPILKRSRAFSSNLHGERNELHNV